MYTNLTTLQFSLYTNLGNDKISEIIQFVKFTNLKNFTIIPSYKIFYSF